MMRTACGTVLRRARRAVTVLPLAAIAVQAQQANPSVAAFGMGDNYTALARGHEALAWNAASLGLPDTPRFSMAIMGLSSNLAYRPVGISEFLGTGSISRATREAWLKAIEQDGSQRGDGMASINFLSLQLGRFGFQLSGVATNRLNLNADAMEALLFGNAGVTGSAKTMAFAGSDARAAGLIVTSAGFALPLPARRGTTQALGVTAKYVQGAFGLLARDAGSTLTPDSLSVRFPLIHTSGGTAGNSGSGFGVDLSYMRQFANTNVAATVHNALNSFAWDEATMVARNGGLSYTTANRQTDFDERPLTAAPAVLRSSLAAYVLKPSVSLGLARRMNRVTVVTADVRRQFGDEEAMLLGPRMHAGVGLEYRGWRLLPIRAGAAYETEGYAFSAGTDIRIGRLGFGVAARYRSVSGANALGLMFSGIGIR